MDYYALVPVDPSRPILRNLYPDGSTMLQQTNTLSFVASSSAGIDTNSVTVTLNGVTVSNLVFTGSANSLTVSDPQLKLNTSYMATIAFTSLREARLPPPSALIPIKPPTTPGKRRILITPATASRGSVLRIRR